MIQLEGRLVETIFHNPENQYRVGILETESQVLTVVGTMPGVKTGDRVRVTGKIIVHARYGEQLQADTCEPLLPETADGIVEYLGSGLLPGIGTKMARRLADAFGQDVFHVLEHHPERLQEVKGIGKRKWLEIAAAFQEHNALRSFVVWMGQQGIDARMSMKLYQAFGDPVRSLLEENPYQVLEVLPEFGFLRVDGLARRLGMDAEDPRRLESGVLAILNQTQGEGHVFLPLENLVEKTREVLQAGEGGVMEAVRSLAMDLRIHLTRLESEEQVVYTHTAFQAETEVARRLAHLAGSSPLNPPARLPEQMESCQERVGISLDQAQIQGIQAAFQYRLLVITGGPGTGKTTLINTLIQVAEGENLSVVLGAPTGRAAKRLGEASGREAKTLHRLLEVAYSEEKKAHYFNRDEEHPLEADLVVVDEVSMVDLFMMQHLLKAIGPATTLVMTGDADQLPPVGPGTVLRDMIHSGLVPMIRLTHIFRQAQESQIVVNAHRINQGDSPVLNDRKKDFFFKSVARPEQAGMVIQSLLTKRLPEYYGFDTYRDIQVLTPTRKGPAGTRMLNRYLQQALNPPLENRRELNHGDRLFREGDRVMQIRNQYSLEWRRKTTAGDGEEEMGRGVFNGDIGRVEAIHSHRESLTVLFDDDRLVDYPLALLDELEPAYAITVHKSQGSEFPVVVMPLFPSPPMLMTRNLLYTAVTRARKLVVLVGSERVMEQMVENNRIQFRHSGLCHRLQQLLTFHQES